jgi:glycosyltransferase involved in cell wall biosynthesis
MAVHHRRTCVERNGPRVKIAIVTSGFEPGATGGTETYLRNLIAALQTVDFDNEYTVYIEPRLAGELPLTAPNFRWAPLRTRAPLARRAIRRALGLGHPGGHVPDPPMVSAIDRAGHDVVHFPLQIINPWGIRSRKVLTFMDMQHEFFPELFIEELLRARRQTYQPSAEAADHIIAISDFTKGTLTEKYGLPLAKVSTVHICYDEALYQRSNVATSLRVDGPYFYYPAASWPHKNHSRLLEAFARVIAVHPEYRLVLTGVAIANRGIGEMVAGLRLTNHVIMPGYLPYEELPAVYRGAYALVYPSLFEGFGIPLCEAMASGCPILAARTTSIPEVAGNAARYFDPMSPRDIADAMLALISAPAERDRLIAAGRARIRNFSSEEMARRTIAVYESIVRKGEGHVTRG